MLNEEEKQFVAWWKENRLKRKRVLRQLYIGLPLAAILVVTIFLNFYSNWYKKAEMVRHQQEQKSNASLVIVLMVAALLIVVFISIFSVRHKWDQHEQKFRELNAHDSQLLNSGENAAVENEKLS
jgi:heme/copper-type cytochrome/quinol oxidase subunit 2